MDKSRLKIVRDPHLKQRTDVAISLAKRVAAGVVETDWDLDMAVRLVLSEHYNLPIFDPYFERPYDELAFEAFLIGERARKKAETPQDVVVKNLDEAAKHAAEGWEDDDEPPTLGEAEKKAMENFMKTGKFQHEGSKK